MAESIPTLRPEWLLCHLAKVGLHDDCDVYSKLTNLRNEAQQRVFKSRESGWRDFHHHQMGSAELIEWQLH